MKWSIFISAATFFLACVFSVVSNVVLENADWSIGLAVVFILILIGVLFDMVGIASAAARETPLHAMAAKKVTGSKQAIRIVRNADRFSNFCNDVIGDISGVISGVASAIVVIKMVGAIEGYPWLEIAVSVVFTGIVSAMTVGFKALGKSVAIEYATDLVLFMGKLFYFLETRFGIRIFAGGRKKSQTGRREQSRAVRKNKPAQ
jgi:CBS domain containing-hemolysin-like protein